MNHTRADFAERFAALIEEYNLGSLEIEQLFDNLLKLSSSLDDEQSRHIRENLTQEELVIFDILTRPAPELDDNERTEVKRIAKDLLARIKGLIVLNWRLKAAARSAVKLGIEDLLNDRLPSRYERTIFSQKCSLVFEHVYEHYSEPNMGTYAHMQ